MSKALAIILIVFISVTGASCRFFGRSSNHAGIKLESRQEQVQFYLCSTCVDIADETIYILKELVMDGSMTRSCEVLCQALQNRTESSVIGGLCDAVCDAVGIKEFIQIVTSADLDPIWYCEIAKWCPSNVEPSLFLMFLS